jgi:prephenate dehydrogenase
MDSVGIVGLGLIGGSFAIGIKRTYPNCRILGMDINSKHAEKAIHFKLVDEIVQLDKLANLDCVIVAVPVDAALDIVKELLNIIEERTWVMDVGSTKEPLCKHIYGHTRRGQFIATHPIAGTEYTGPEAALPDLFLNKIQIICEAELSSPKVLEQANGLFQKLGMIVKYMHPSEHDLHLAFVSHLSHISSFMLGKTVMEEEKNEKTIFEMAGSGFSSTVRLAKSSPEMWTPIFKQNSVHIIRAIDNYVHNLTEFRDKLSEGDYVSIYNQLKEINTIRTIIDRID